MNKPFNPIDLKFKQLFFSDLIPGSLVITYHKTITYDLKNNRSFGTFVIQKIQLILSLHNGFNKTIPIHLDPDAYMKTFVLFERKRNIIDHKNYLCDDIIYTIDHLNILDFLQSNPINSSIYNQLINP